MIESHKEKHDEKHKEKHEEKHDEKHKEKHEEEHEEKHEDCLIEDHDEKHKEKHEDHLIEDHDKKTWRSFDFDKESWQKNMIESHEEKLCRLFNQVIYIYLIFCQVELSFQVELSNQASQLNSSSWIQLLNLTQHFFKKNSTQLNTFWVKYSTQCNQSIQKKSIEQILQRIASMLTGQKDLIMSLRKLSSDDISLHAVSSDAWANLKKT